MGIDGHGARVILRDIRPLSWGPWYTVYECGCGAEARSHYCIDVGLGGCSVGCDRAETAQPRTMTSTAESRRSMLSKVADIY